MRYEVTIHVQKWQELVPGFIEGVEVEEATVRLLKESLARSQGADQATPETRIRCAEFLPNFSTPCDYREGLDPTAWSLWSAVKLLIDSNYSAEAIESLVEEEFRKRLDVPIHVEVEEVSRTRGEEH